MVSVETFAEVSIRYFNKCLVPAAPEILRGRAYGGPPVDIYSFVVIVYCMASGSFFPTF